ncbi:MAG TPA: hypothetical protein VLT47_00205 [Anaeromyxobacteraceae bacterium]|nr:hypothetical protein [Anaeromyxobacteraceae bacterium]
MIGLALTLSLLLAASGADSVVLTTGERIEGRVIDASPSAGVKVLLPDGRVRWIHPMSVERIDRADGTSVPFRPEPASPSPSPAEAPVTSPLGPPAPPPPPVERAWREEPPVAIDARPEPVEERPRSGTAWFAFAAGHAKPLGRSARSGPTLEALVGDGHTALTLEGGLRFGERNSIGAVLDFTSSNIGDELRPLCARYGSDCDTATAQLGVFLRRDFDPRGQLNPWASIGIGREWLAGEVFEPTGGGDSVQLLSAPGWQLPRVGLGIDWRTSRLIGFGVYAALALGVYDRVTIDRVNVGDGPAVHGWAQLGVRAILGP